jgi:mannose-6-phosphate isomerase-like protein (cupin superfamily)
MNTVKIVNKLWGYEKIIVNTDKYCGKIIHINEFNMGSFHYHKIKDETFYLLSGKVKIKYSLSDNYENSEDIIMNPGDTFRIYPELRHQIIGIEESDLLEFSTHDIDDDSYRVISSENFLGGHNG